MARKNKSKHTHRSLAVKAADKAMSDYIRYRDKYKCCTCPKEGDKHNIDCGHFVPRGHWIFRYDERNTHAQCCRCNKYLGGAWPEYYDFMVNKYGKEVVEEMISRKNELANYSIPDLLEIEQKYKDKLQALKEERGE